MLNCSHCTTDSSRASPSTATTPSTALGPDSFTSFLSGVAHSRTVLPMTVTTSCGSVDPANATTGMECTELDLNGSVHRPASRQCRGGGERAGRRLLGLPKVCWPPCSPLTCPSVRRPRLRWGDVAPLQPRTARKDAVHLQSSHSRRAERMSVGNVPKPNTIQMIATISRLCCQA